MKRQSRRPLKTNKRHNPRVRTNNSAEDFHSFHKSFNGNCKKCFEVKAKK